MPFAEEGQRAVTKSVFTKTVPTSGVEYGKVMVTLARVDLDIESWFSSNILKTFTFMGGAASPVPARPRQRRRVDENGDAVFEEAEEQRQPTPPTVELLRRRWQRRVESRDKGVGCCGGGGGDSTRKQVRVT